MRGALALLLFAALAYAHGGSVSPPPPPRQPNWPPGAPGSAIPPGYRLPPGTPTPTPPDPPPTPGPHNGGEDTSGGTITPPEAAKPKPPTTPTGGKRPRTRAYNAKGAEGQSWRIWWEYNREQIVGFRGLLKGRATLTPAEKGAGIDPVGSRRGEIFRSLSHVALNGRERLVRASALIALGRLGDERAVSVFLTLLRDSKQPADVHEAAALGLGMLGPIRSEKLRKATREHLAYLLDNAELVHKRLHAFLWVATGMRARDDKQLMLRLADRIVKGARSGEEAVVLAFACGLAGNRMLTPELMAGAQKNRFAGARLNEIGRSHAVHAVGRLDDPGAFPLLVRLVRSRSARVDSRRAAVLSIGRLLRRGRLTADQTESATKLLKATYLSKRDPVLRGFAAVSLGGAKEPAAIYEFQQAIDRGGNSEVKAFSALALGLAARNLDADRARRVRAFLSQELNKTKEQGLSSALSIAMGLAGSDEALDLLLDRVEEKSTGIEARGAAAQAVGLIGRPTPRAAQVLGKIIDEGPRQLLGEAALALGMLGQRSSALQLVQKLAKTKSALHMGRIMLALGHLGSSAAIDPLLKILEDETERSSVREFAAVALGLLATPYEQDPLFDLDADFNYLATTPATAELIRLY